MGSHKDPWPHDEEQEARSSRLAGRLVDWLLLILATVVLAAWAAVRFGR